MYDMFGMTPASILLSSKLSRNGRWRNIKPPRCIAAFQVQNVRLQKGKYTSSSIARYAMIQFGDTVGQTRCAHERGASVICWAGRAGIVFCICAAVAATALLREEVDPPSLRFLVWITREEFRKKAVYTLITRDHVPRWWNSVQ